MSNLIITVISIALAALLAIAGIWYGGAVFNEGKARTVAATMTTQAQQIYGATVVYQVANQGTWPDTVEQLVPQYLKSVPVPPSTTASAGFELISSAYAASGLTWSYLKDNSGRPVYVVSSGGSVGEPPCLAVEDLRAGRSTLLSPLVTNRQVPTQVDPAYDYQCAATGAQTRTFFWRLPGATAAAACEGIDNYNVANGTSLACGTIPDAGAPAEPPPGPPSYPVYETDCTLDFSPSQLTKSGQDPWGGEWGGAPGDPAYYSMTAYNMPPTVSDPSQSYLQIGNTILPALSYDGGWDIYNWFSYYGPPATSAHTGPVPVYLFNDDGSICGGTLEYVHDRLSISDMFPSQGPAAGGNAVTFAGSGLEGATVRILLFDPNTWELTGAVLEPLLVEGFPGGTELDVVMPSAPAGTYAYVEVTGLDGTVENWQYQWMAFGVDGITPGTAYSGEPNVVAITGFDFPANAQVSAETDGGTPVAATILSQTSSEIVLEVPAITDFTGYVNFWVRDPTPGMEFADQSIGAYFSSIAIDYLSTNSGPMSGGTEVEVYGMYFDAGTQFRVDGNLATVLSVESRESIAGPGHFMARIVTPPSTTGGWVNIVAERSDGNLSNPYGFNYPQPTLNAIYSNSGLYSGGQLVNITGSGWFTPSTTVSIGGQDASAVYVSSTTLSATVPGIAPIESNLSVDVVVQDPAWTSTKTSWYTYTAPTLTRYSTLTGSHTGGGTYDVYGNGWFTPSSTVTVGGQPAVTTYISPTRLRWIAPAFPEPTPGTPVSVDVTVQDGAVSRTLTNYYQYSYRFTGVMVFGVGATGWQYEGTAATCPVGPSTVASEPRNHYLLTLVKPLVTPGGVYQPTASQEIANQATYPYTLLHREIEAAADAYLGTGGVPTVKHCVAVTNLTVPPTVSVRKYAALSEIQQTPSNLFPSNIPGWWATDYNAAVLASGANAAGVAYHVVYSYTANGSVSKWKGEYYNYTSTAPAYHYVSNTWYPRLSDTNWAKLHQEFTLNGAQAQVVMLYAVNGSQEAPPPRISYLNLVTVAESNLVLEGCAGSYCSLGADAGSYPFAMIPEPLDIVQPYTIVLHPTYLGSNWSLLRDSRTTEFSVAGPATLIQTPSLYGFGTWVRFEDNSTMRGQQGSNGYPYTGPNIPWVNY